MELESRSDMIKHEIMIEHAQNGLEVFIQASECQISESLQKISHPYEERPLGEAMSCADFSDSFQHAQIPGYTGNSLPVLDVIHSARHLANCKLIEVGK